MRKPDARTVPARLRELHGYPDHQSFTTEEPEGVGDIWSPPGYFDDEQRAEWHYAVEHAPAGVLSGTDRGLLTIWVAASVEHARALVEVRRAGQVVKTKDGNVIQNPYLPILNRQAMIMLRAGAEMGFSPASRAVLGRLAGEGWLDGSTPRGPGSAKRSRLSRYLEAKPDKLAN